MRKIVTHVAKKLTRPAQETAQLGDWSSTIAKALVLSALLGGLIGFLLPFLSEEIDSWKLGKPTIRVNPQDWRVVYQVANGAEACSAVAQKNIECLAHPQNPILWQSPHRRSDVEHLKRLKDLKKEYFWVGTEIGPDQLEDAEKVEAYHFILGRIEAQHRIWVNGELVKAGSYENGALPIVLDLPASKFSSGNPIQIAIEVFHNVGSSHPDLFGGALGEGLATAKQVRNFTSRILFWNTSGPWLLFGLYFLMGLIFLTFWSMSRKKQEYAYFGMFALTGAFVYLMNIELFYTKLAVSLRDQLFDSLRFYFGSFALFLGLAFARTRRGFFLFGIPLLMVVPPAFFGSDGNRWMETAITFAIFAGAMVCLIQAYWLKQECRNLTCVPVRLKRLVGFGGGLALLAVFHWLHSREPVDVYRFDVWYHVCQFGVVMWLAVLTLREYRESERMTKTTPVSEFHREPVLAERLDGVVLALDVKGSESLFLHGARRGDTGRLMQICISHLTTSVLSNGGVMMRTEGDQLVSFFAENAKLDSAMVRAIRMLKHAAKELPVIEKSFRDQNLLPLDIGLSFRAGIAYGSMKPVWKEFGSTRVAGWEQVAETTPVEDAEDLMLAEKEIPNLQRDHCNVVMTEEHTGKVPAEVDGDPVHWKARDQQIDDIKIAVLCANAAGDVHHKQSA